MIKLKALGITIISSIVLSSVGVTAAERWNVMESSQKFVVDGKSVKTEALTINDSNYVKVAEFAKLLDIDISYNETTNTIAFDKSKPFLGVRNENSSDIEASAENQVINIDIPLLNGSVQYGPYSIKTGDTIEYAIKGEGKVTFLYALFSDEKDWKPGLITPEQSNHQLYRTITYTGSGLFGDFIATEDGIYYLYIVSTGDTSLENVMGTVTIEK